MQADVCDPNSLRNVINDVRTLYGPIENIIHTAVVVFDATIQTVTNESFESVLRPKVIGAWNLHMISEELRLPLKSFVLLGRVRLVSLSAPFFILSFPSKYFLQCSAGEPRTNCLRRSYRHSLGCLQLGAWEFKLVKKLEFSTGFVHPIKHEKGIPLILKAILTPISVQVTADFDVEKLASAPVYAQDPLLLAGRR